MEIDAFSDLIINENKNRMLFSKSKSGPAE